MGFASSVPASSKETTGRKQTGGGGKRIIGGGVQHRFWEGVLWYVFPSPEFSHPPLFLSEISQTGCGNICPQLFLCPEGRKLTK